MELFLIILFLALLALIFWPRRSSRLPRDIASSRNGQAWWRDKEPY